MATESRSVLISVDGSIHSSRAFDWYAANMWRNDDQVFIFHVAEPPSLPSVSLNAPVAVPVEEWKTIMENRISAINKIEEDYTQRAIQKKMKYTFVQQTTKQIGEGIVAYTQEKNINMIVMGCRGLGTLRRTFLGSVSDYVLHHSGKPVTVIPPEN